MTIEEIEERKQILLATVSVPDVLSRYGIQVKKGSCVPIRHPPARGNEKNRSAKVSESLYYCFVCQKNMDIFDITIHFNNCDFWTAFELLGGAEKPSFTAQRKAKTAMKERQSRIIKAEKEKAELKLIRARITAYRERLRISDPLSDEWCEYYNKLQYQIYLLEYMTDEEKR